MKINGKLVKIIGIVTIIIIALNVCIPVSMGFSGLAAAAGGETPNMPAPPSTDAPQTDLPSTPTQTEKQTTITKIIEYYNAIEGNVCEDLGMGIGRDGNDSANIGRSIAGVKVELLDSGGNTVSSTITDESGYYKFIPSPGRYSTRFVYGDIDGVNKVNKTLIRNILKYNGQDYMATAVPSTSGTTSNIINIEEREIIRMGKAVTQVFLAIDESPSAYTETVTLSDGTSVRRIDREISATRELIQELLSSDNSIYLGIVSFSGDGWRSVSLTRDEEKLNKALDYLAEGGRRLGWTNINGGLSKAKESFYNKDPETSNRVIAMISDCIPTKSESAAVYNDEGEAAILSKLYDIIGPETKAKVQQLRSEGIKVMSLVTESEDQETKDFVEGIFKDTTDLYVSIDNDTAFVNAITRLLKDEILSIEQKEQEYVSESTWYSEGYENEDRRNEVNQNFSQFNYKNTKLFDVINTYQVAQYEKAKQLSDLTKMYVTGGTYMIEAGGENTTETYLDEDGDEITVYTTYVAKSYSNQDLYLGLRSTPDILITTTITGLKIILSDGQILPIVINEMNSDFPILQTLDPGIAYGSTVQIEYQIQVSNKSMTQYNHLEVIDYLPEGFQYIPDIQLISASGDNSSNNWQKVDNLEELCNNEMIARNTYDNCKERCAIKAVLDNENKGPDGFYLSPGGKLDLRVVVSKLVSNLDYLGELLQDNHNMVEILAYSNVDHRRMALKEKDETTSSYLIKKLTPLYPGDLRNQDASLKATNELFITPPFGREEIISKLIIIILTCSTIIVLIIINDRRKNVNKVK